MVGHGINGKMNEVQAAFGLVQLQHVNWTHAARARIDAYYRERLGDVKGLRLHRIDAGSTPNHAYFPVLVTPEFALSRDALYAELRARQIAVRRYFYPLISEFPAYSGLASAVPDNLPVAQAIAQQVLCLPVFPMLEREVQDRIIDIVLAASATTASTATTAATV